MSDTKPNISVNGIDWVNVNVLANIAVGTRMLMANTGSSPIWLYEGDTKPSPSTIIGKPLTTRDGKYMEMEATDGSLTIWAITTRGSKYESLLNVESFETGA